MGGKGKKANPPDILFPGMGLETKAVSSLKQEVKSRHVESKRQGKSKEFARTADEKAAKDKKNRCTVLLKGLPEDISDRKIKTLMSEVGPIAAIKTARNKETDACLGFAGVEYKFEDIPARA